jgi:hypothetical protein
MPAAMSDKLIAVLSFLPNTTYDLPGLNLLAKVVSLSMMNQGVILVVA